MRRLWLGLAASLALVCAISGCNGGTEAEPLDAAGEERFTPVMVDAAADAEARDAPGSDLIAPDSSAPDLAAPDLVAPDLVAPDQDVPDAAALDVINADHVSQDAGAGDASPADAARADAPMADAADAAVEDSGLPTLPPLRIEIDQDNWSDEMYIDWFSPSGLECEEWDDTETCDWGAEGQISISGDEYGNADPNWAELSEVQLLNGFYRAYAYSYCVDMETCEVDAVRVYVDGQLVRTLGEDRDLTYGSQSFCMPVVDGAWDVAAFAWQYMSACD